MSEKKKLFDLDVEDMLLALAVQSPDIATNPQFSPDLFTEERVSLASCIPHLWVAREPITATTLKVGGCSDEGLDAFSFIADKFASDPPEGDKADSLFKSLREYACMRHMEESARRRHAECLQGEAPAEAILERLQGNCSKAERILDTNASQTRDGAHINNLMELIVRRVENPGHIDGLETGFPLMDRMLNGLQPSLVYLIGARPHVGKTTLSLAIMLGLLQRGVRCGFFSLEMEAIQLQELVLQIHSGVNTHQHIEGKFTKQELTRLKESMAKMQEFKWRIDDRDRIDLQAFKARARHLRRQHDCQVMFVDYVQIMRGQERRGQERRNEVGEISAALKALAKELHIPIIAMSQITRQEPRFDKVKERTVYPRPRLDGLKESGDLEQDADVVILLHRDVSEKPQPGQGTETKATGIIAKNRATGKLGDVPLLFNHTTAEFRENPIR